MLMSSESLLKKQARLREIESLLGNRILTRQLAVNGDVHLQNVKRMFGVVVSKSHPLR